MKVTGQQPPRTPELSSGKSRETEARPDRERQAVKDAPLHPGGRTSLTMSRIREVIRSTPDVRADRVDTLREKIRSGDYKVDANRLAHNILTESVRDDVEKP